MEGLIVKRDIHRFGGARRRVEESEAGKQDGSGNAERKGARGIGPDGGGREKAARPYAFM